MSDSVTLWTVAHQDPLSMGFSRQEYWSGLLCLPPGDLPDPGIKPQSLASPALADGFFTTEPSQKPHVIYNYVLTCQICLPRWHMVMNPSANAGDARDTGSISGSERSSGEGNGNPLQYSCLGIHGLAKSQTRLSD